MGPLIKRSLVYVTQLCLLMTAAPSAMAYIGPGSGISVIGSLLGLLVTIILTLGAIALFPFRRMMKKRAQAQSGEGEGLEPEAASVETASTEEVNSK